MEVREIIARRAAKELNDGEVANLGFGMPTQAVNYLPKGIKLIMHTENGAFGFGGKPNCNDADSDVSNAGSEPVTLLPGAACMSLATSLGAMRNGYIDVTILGALEVDQFGNIANWAVKRDGLWWPGIGGAMELTYGTKKIIATLQHTDKNGNSKIKKKCELPLTGKRCVKTIITEKAVFDVGEDMLILREIYPGLSLEDIKAITEADFIVGEDLKDMEL
ncbi:3-oxoacid CoA-transferase subunit B [Clostridium brassicae]|uniref:3-oxoacid CoA-transferase subunit B n=1 Tax=Clostridium brassicae TaxID=2999072 RepID=A0ABT4DCV0_9CLOT|nr:3-oxoacid CoA-transferase subunit B [Clostridium brassicae]MCY6960147.1 3-oxoacid CoA-transferase subunit B [Clostridium brassicae]